MPGSPPRRRRPCSAQGPRPDGLGGQRGKEGRRQGHRADCGGGAEVSRGCPHRRPAKAAPKLRRPADAAPGPSGPPQPLRLAPSLASCPRPGPRPAPGLRFWCRPRPGQFESPRPRSRGRPTLGPPYGPGPGSGVGPALANPSRSGPASGSTRPPRLATDPRLRPCPARAPCSAPASAPGPPRLAPAEASLRPRPRPGPKPRPGNTPPPRPCLPLRIDRRAHPGVKP